MSAITNLSQALSSVSSALVTLQHDVSSPSAFRTVTSFCREQWGIPAFFCVSYLVMVYAARRPMAQHSHMLAVDRCFAAWNLFLSVFSTWGVYHMGKGLYNMTEKRGLQFTICGSTGELVQNLQDGPTALALCLFCFSKIPELMDTVFLILKGKKVRFLQWYHHATVMLFCWLALATEYTPGLWFAATNYFVHSIMYMYFFLMTFKTAAGIVKPIAPLITIIQISQMVWGLIVNAIAVGTFFTTGNCQIQAVTVYSAIVMYASYFYLFGQLFLEAHGTAGKNKKKFARELSRKISEALTSTGEEVSKHLKVN